MNQHQTITHAMHKKIFNLGQKTPRLSNRAIAAKLGIHYTSVMRYRDQEPVTPAAIQPESIPTAIMARLKKGPATAAQLAEALKIRNTTVQTSIKGMQRRGSLIIKTADGRFDVAPAFLSQGGRGVAVGSKRDEWTHVFGVVSDNHLCNKHSRLDVLNAAYDHFEREGITTVYNAGNWIDGEARFNKMELITAPGMDNQLDYMIDKYPQRKGITTNYIAGDDHEGWYAQREGVEIGKYLQFRAEDQGRKDLKYLGYGEADVALQCGDSSAVMRVLHPGGGSSYAISYTDQKRMESYQGGEKPDVELAGHYHKFNYGYPREVHAVQVGCTEDQSMFMRKKKLQAHVGFVVIKIKQDSGDGHVTRFSPEFFPYFDRGYYEKRF